MGPMWRFLIRNWKTLLLGAVLPMAGIMLWAGITTALGYSGMLPLTAIFSLLAPPLAAGLLIVLAAATVIDLSIGAASLVMASSRSGYQYMTGTGLGHDSDDDFDGDFTADRGNNQFNTPSSQSGTVHQQHEDRDSDSDSDTDDYNSTLKQRRYVTQHKRNAPQPGIFFSSRRSSNESLTHPTRYEPTNECPQTIPGSTPR